MNSVDLARNIDFRKVVASVHFVFRILPCLVIFFPEFKWIFPILGEMYHAASVPHLGQPSAEQNEVGERENEAMEQGDAWILEICKF